MSLETRIGNLFDSYDLEALAHGCNCAGAMGAGIAVEFRSRWPQMYEEYRKRCRSGDFRLGDVFAYDADGLKIYNLATQQHWRSKAELWAIQRSVRAMLEDAEQVGLGSVGIPRIGSGLGGQPWQAVKEILSSEARDTSVKLVVHEFSERSIT